MLRAEHITKQYSLPDSGHTVFDAVSDVSLELKDGCVSSLVGGKAEVEKALWQESCPTLSCLTLEKCFLVIWRSLPVSGKRFALFEVRYNW